MKNNYGMKQARAFAPGHITGLFQICKDSSSPLKTGSRGAGVSLGRGVTTTIRLTRGGPPTAKIILNGQISQDAIVSRHALELFMQLCGNLRDWSVCIEHSIDIPLGCGFGSSGAGALSLLLALNKATGQGLNFTEVVSLAHRTEVEMSTGLGTVMGEAWGGMEIRELPGAPGYGKLRHIQLEKDYCVLCLLFGSLSTARLLHDQKLTAQITQAGKSLIDGLLLSPSLESFQKASGEFTQATGLLSPRLSKIMHYLKTAGFTSSMLMFGDGLFLIAKNSEISQAEELLKPYLPEATLFRSPIDFKGARVL